MDWNKIFGDILEALIPILVALLTALVGYAITFLKKKTDALKDEKIKTLIDNALDEAESVADDAIAATQQKFVDDIKKAREDGKLTKEEAAQALEMAKQYFISHIKGSSKSILQQLFPNFEQWLGDFIEAKIGQEKRFQ